MRLRTAAATVFATAILLGGAASTASAGEITGNGKPTQGPAHANSICVFSGQNDDPTAPIISADPIPEAPNGPGGRTQSYGQDVRHGLIDPHQFNPGDACRGGSNPDRP
ncbi:MAG TPA: hypothetical protein VF241_13925 [Propionibacteriaceae bacterium]